MDKFPEAFRRFENDVNIGNVTSYRQLILAFRWWAGQRWRGTSKQWQAFNNEARTLGFEAPEMYSYRRQAWQSGRFAVNSERHWREETVKIKGESKIKYRDVKTGRFIKKP